MLFERIGICCLNPAHECEMRAYLVYLLIVKSWSILFQFSHSVLNWTNLVVGFFRIFKEYFLRGLSSISLYRDYIVNRSSFIHWSLVLSQVNHPDPLRGSRRCVRLRDTDTQGQWLDNLRTESAQWGSGGGKEIRASNVTVSTDVWIFYFVFKIIILLVDHS